MSKWTSQLQEREDRGSGQVLQVAAGVVLGAMAAHARVTILTCSPTLRVAKADVADPPGRHPFGIDAAPPCRLF